MKYFICLFTLVLLFSCQSKNEGASTAPAGSGGTTKTEPIGTKDDNCAIHFSKSDTTEDVAVKSSRLRTECRYENEEQVVKRLHEDLDQ